MHRYLAECADVNDAGVRARVFGFADACIAQGLAVFGVIPRAQPCACFYELRAALFVPFVQRRAAQGMKVHSAFARGDCADGYRRVWRAEGRNADIAHLFAAQGSQTRRGVDGGGLALVVCHPGSCVAFGVFGGAVSFAVGEVYVGEGDIVLEVNKRFRGRFVFVRGD